MALRSINQQHDSIDHLQSALDFATEVRVARSVDDVDDDSAVGAGSGIVDGSVLRQDRDAFSFSRSLESITRSTSSPWAANAPVWRNIWSTSVVLPWSTWATMATFRMSFRVARV